NECRHNLIYWQGGRWAGVGPGAHSRLGRQHSAREALAAFDVARSAFERTSFDLIYARPGQAVDGWRSELGQAIALHPGHLSLYQLTIEPGTRYFDLHRAGKLNVPAEELAADLYIATQEACDAAGLAAYEISNHASPGNECRHNLIYWQGGRWAGIGPGAHSRLGCANADRRALTTERMPERWLGEVEAIGHAVVEDHMLDSGAAADELILMAMRTSLGLDLAHHAILGGSIDEEKRGQLVDQGLVEIAGNGARLRLTPSGRLVANAVITELAASGPAEN
ncbi:MAG: hypothetical protein HKN60_02190, partial [Rhizobiales bacterium]|nr:hypothetical protein [Hyphomicrobiales bacterium]